MIKCLTSKQMDYFLEVTALNHHWVEEGVYVFATLQTLFYTWLEEPQLYCQIPGVGV